jgi:hypothetical protein
MEVEQSIWTRAHGWRPGPTERRLRESALVLAFGAGELLAERYAELREAYPGSAILGCSTAGEILDSKVSDDTVVATAVAFSSTTLRRASARAEGIGESRAAGMTLAGELRGEGLAHVFVLSDGLSVNGSELVKGIIDGLPAGVGITGGLAADGPRFRRTLAFLDAPPSTGTVAAIGLYGKDLRVGYGSVGGWDPFGVEWEITRSNGSVLYELDGQSALDLYKSFLGDRADGLPAAGLLFPLSLRMLGVKGPVVRTLLAVDEDEGSLTFAGDMPRGAYARFMKANFDRLVEGAGRAAQDCALGLGSSGPELAILISCVGRKLVLKQRVEEEVEAVRDVIGPRAAMAGFYSYGELAPVAPLAPCELHNQTMTITAFAEESGCTSSSSGR